MIINLSEAFLLFIFYLLEWNRGNARWLPGDVELINKEAESSCRFNKETSKKKIGKIELTVTGIF